MNTHELIESTMLHALGLLDDAEREAYEAAFDTAPKQVQTRVRQEAQRMADLGDLTTDVDPSLELRSMVLAAVRAAISEDANETRIASEKAVPSPVIGRIDPSTITPTVASGPRATSQPKLSSSPRVHRAWRVATIGFAAASIAIGVVTVSMQQTFNQAQSKALVTNLYDTIGAKYLEATIFDGNTQRVALTSQTNTTAVAAVWSNPDWDTARLFIKNIAAESDRPLRLVVLDADGEIVREVATFSPSGEFQDFNVDLNLATERSLAIYPSMVEDIKNASPLLLSTQSEL